MITAIRKGESKSRYIIDDEALQEHRLNWADSLDTL